MSAEVPSDDAIVVTRVAIDRGSRSVLRDVSFIARFGEVLCIAGPNGAGKTSLLRAIAGLAPFRGDIRLPRPEVGAAPFAYVPQRSQLRAALPVRRVVEQGRHRHADLLGRLGREDRRRVDEALRDADAAELAARPFTELSEGEQRRVLIARALATGSKILLLDEPTAALDLKHALGLHALLRALAARGYAIVVVLHAVDDVLCHTDRTLLLHRGRVHALGPSPEVFTAETVRAVYGVRMMPGEGARFELDAAATTDDDERAEAG